jgi:hypothetical protein
MRRPAPLHVVAAANAGNNDCISRGKLCITFPLFTIADVTRRVFERLCRRGSQRSAPATQGRGYESSKMMKKKACIIVVKKENAKLSLTSCLPYVRAKIFHF